MTFRILGELSNHCATNILNFDHVITTFNGPRQTSAPRYPLAPSLFEFLDVVQLRPLFCLLLLFSQFSNIITIALNPKSRT